MEDGYKNWIYMMDKMQSIKYFSRMMILKTTKEYNVPAEQLDLLSQLSVYNDKITPMNLSKIMRVNKTIISRAIDPLYNQGLLTKVKDENDGRSYFVEITDLGREKLDEIYGYYLGPIYELRRRLGEEEFFKLIEVIEGANNIMEEK
ncbi:MAG: MarR family winged helix-turn-helix transcriptional regulator [Clostridium sp.]|nr:MarR family winged helix-turn-helix transcriptional regulator [Clostridium sp.]